MININLELNGAESLIVLNALTLYLTQGNTEQGSTEILIKRLRNEIDNYWNGRSNKIEPNQISLLDLLKENNNE